MAHPAEPVKLDMKAAVIRMSVCRLVLRVGILLWRDRSNLDARHMEQCTLTDGCLPKAQL